MTFDAKSKFKCYSVYFSSLHNSHLPYKIILAMSKTPHIQYLCGFARHDNLFYHSQNLWFCIYSNNQLQMV